MGARADRPGPDLTVWDLEVWSRTVWGEARGEGASGMRWVAQTIWNRCLDPRWPSSPAGVCLQPKQFSCWNHSDPNLSRMAAIGWDDELLAVARAACESVYAGVMPDPTSAANHYLATYLLTRGEAPSWAKPTVACGVQGAHTFFKL